MLSVRFGCNNIIRVIVLRKNLVRLKTIFFIKISNIKGGGGGGSGVIKNMGKLHFIAPSVATRSDAFDDMKLQIFHFIFDSFFTFYGLGLGLGLG